MNCMQMRDPAHTGIRPRVRMALTGPVGECKTSKEFLTIKVTVATLKVTVATLNNIRFEIRNAGLRWKRARIALTSKDPDYCAKLDAIKRVLKCLSSDEAFFSIDELGPER